MRPMTPVLLCAVFAGCSDDGEVTVVDTDQDGVRDEYDCAPDDAAVHPGALEICNGLDDDCDAGTNEAGARVGATSYADLQAAIDAAPAGATVQVCGGTYLVHLVVRRDLVLESFAGPELTVLDGGGAGHVIHVSDGADLTLRGFSVTGGAGADAGGIVPWFEGNGGGGLFAAGAGAIAVEGSHFYGHATEGGAAILVLASESLTGRDTVVSDTTPASAAPACSRARSAPCSWSA